ncbi:MAG: hypothetical protein EB153_09140, partial [Nitrosopumilaceae archaeon]|nr:hypothetical protein [Nitrosopumilaceae archaeon]
ANQIKLVAPATAWETEEGLAGMQIGSTVSPFISCGSKTDICFTLIICLTSVHHLIMSRL